MNRKINWQRLFRKGLLYVLVAIIASASTFAVVGQQNSMLTGQQGVIDWKFMGQPSMEQLREGLEAEKLALEASKQELEASKQELAEMREETAKLLDQLLATNTNIQDLLSAAEQKEKEVSDKIDELKDAFTQVENQEQQRWVMPIQYTYISSPFGYRVHPITGEGKTHYGVDMAAPMGTPIVASRSGTVSAAAYEADGAGNYVNINHMDGYVTRYMHMDRYIVSPGQFVFAGQIIGYCGSTGASTGPHLHFGVYYNGRAVDPGKYIDI